VPDNRSDITYQLPGPQTIFELSLSHPCCLTSWDLGICSNTAHQAGTRPLLLILRISSLITHTKRSAMLAAHSQGTLPRGVKPFTQARQCTVQPATARRGKQAAVQCAAAQSGTHLLQLACNQPELALIAVVVLVVALLLLL
jgi:hypothetical protein